MHINRIGSGLAPDLQHHQNTYRFSRSISSWGWRLALMVGAISGAMWGTISAPAQAIEQFDNQGIQFNVDTVVEFEFIEANGLYRSIFGVINLATREKTPLIVEDRLSDQLTTLSPMGQVDPSQLAGLASSTPGGAVSQPFAEFQFLANTPYAFYLESYLNGRMEQTFYSVDVENSNRDRRVVMVGDMSDLGQGGVMLQWDDTGSLLVPLFQQDQDFDDFIVRAGGFSNCRCAPRSPQ